MRVLVLGGGIAGAATALGAARRGHDVVVIDRDRPDTSSAADETFTTWDRPGIPQFRQPHNFLGLGRRLLRERLPDVYRALLQAGAVEVEQFRFITDGTSAPGDEDFAVIGCRRPVFDSVLGLALLAEPGVEQRVARATGLVIDRGRRRTVRGVVLEGDERMAADIVVDAMGRTSRVPGWLVDEGLDPPTEQGSECGLVYHSRHFRIRAGADMPPYASLLAGPRGDIGYLAFATFVGDSRTFCLCIMTPPGDRDFAALRRPDIFLRIAERLPGVASWVDPAIAEPITAVLPMGRLRNAWRRYVVDGRPIAPGLQPVGDSLCHTNPTFAFGASLALRDAFAVADALDTARDEADLACTVDTQVSEDSRRRYEAVTAEDRDRARLWRGEPIDVTDPAASMPLFLRSVVYRMAVHDSSVLRAVCRRINLLDPPDALEQDAGVLLRARDLFEAMRADGSLPPSGPSRSDLLASLEP